MKLFIRIENVIFNRMAFFRAVYPNGKIFQPNYIPP